MALRSKEEVLLELKEIDTLLMDLDAEAYRLRKMKKGIIEAYGINEVPKRTWTRKKKEESEQNDS